MKTEAHNILSLYFERKKMAYPSYSLRALARDLGVSPAYVSTILSGKKELPEKRLQDFIKFLDLDDIAILQLKKVLFPNEKKESSGDKQLAQDDIDFLNKHTPLDKKKFEILNEWYNIAILDLTTCEGFDSSPSWIAKKLKINQLQVEIAIENLKRLGFLTEKDNKLQKVDLQIRFPTKISSSVIRKFHKSMIKKAYEELDTKVEDSAFSQRLITSSTFALNSSKIELVKEKIQNVLYEASLTASEGPCQSVYQLNIQLFPLTK